MRYFHYLTFAICLLGTVFSFGQNELFSHYKAVYYETGNSQLSAEQQQYLENFLQKFGNKKELYSFQLSGFADKRGSSKENLELSLKRANVVKEILIQKGYLEKQIETIGNGVPSTYLKYHDKNSLAKDRRVEIRVSLKAKELENIGTYRLNKKKVVMNVKQQKVFYYSSGTKIKIPANAFVNLANQPITGQITILYTEYRNPLDFVLSGIPMSVEVDGKLLPFNSAGMFNIQAFQGDKEVFLGKGKQIGIELKLTGNTTDWNLYSFNKDAHQWNDEKENPTNRIDAQSIAEMEPVRKCGGTNCQKMMYLVEEGERRTIFGVNDVPNYQYLLKADSINTADKRRAQIENYHKMKYGRLLNFYYCKEYKGTDIKKKKDRRYFTVHGINTKTNDAVPLENIIWETTKKHNDPIDVKKVISSSNSKKWGIYYEEKKKAYRIYLGGYNCYANPVLTPLAKKKQAQQEAFNKLLTERNELLKKYNAQRKFHSDKFPSYGIRMIGQEEAKLRNSVRHLSGNIPIKDAPQQLRNLECFWVLNRPYMNEEEKKLEMLDWYTYLYKNHKKLRKRYKNIKNDPSYATCKTEVTNLQQLKRNVASVQNKVLSLNISSMGIYNCDAVHRMQDPLLVNTKYKGKDGLEIEIAVIYVLDDQLNGVVRYDGYMGFDPYGFNFDRNSKNQLIAIDETGKLYVANSEQFIPMIKSIDENKPSPPFILEPVGDGININTLLN